MLLIWANHTFRCPTGGCCCPAGQQCVNDVCCPLPACSNGILSATMCGIGNICPQGMECNNGGCCPLPMCPSGAQPSGRCQGNSCPIGQVSFLYNWRNNESSINGKYEKELNYSSVIASYPIHLVLPRIISAHLGDESKLHYHYHS